MSLRAAASGLVVFLLSVSVIQGQDGWGVTYTSTEICALKGSTVEINCTYRYPSRINERDTKALQLQVVNPTPKNTGGSSAIEAVLKCNGSCSPADRLSYVWYENGAKLEEGSSSYPVYSDPAHSFSCAVKGLEDFPSPSVSLQVQVSRVTVHQFYTETELKCHSSCSPAGRLSYVWLKNGEKITMSPSAEIVEGSSVTLTCSSDANPAANYTWYKENGNITSLSKEPELVFRSIQSSDSGEYYCTAENELGPRTSEYISINVKYPPKLPSVSVSPSAEIVEGSSVTLTCSSDANPAANYTWYKKNGNITSLSKEPQLVFRSIQSSDSGEYYCTAENELGTRTSGNIISINVTIKKRGEKRDDRNQGQQPQQDNLHYASVEFSNIEPAQRRRHKQEDEENVEYAAVKVKSGSTAARKKCRESDLAYASIEFSNIKPTQRRRHKQEENVEYAGVKVKSGSTAARKKHGEKRDDRNQGQRPEQDNLHYACVEFSNNKPAQRRRHKQENEENVAYAGVNVKSGSTAARNRESSEENLAAEYSKVNKPC
ncbi:hypothetical protein L3Q82_020014 [Scortum barcoo]|uniref:Uncharacterized protein n=1 Tax=Scortum barcoo TaxID=214431 RepID=A0ACB8VE34_9TELE|nr:hypothetical protein L3Q82_020014 [Scortum barcoo]